MKNLILISKTQSNSTEPILAKPPRNEVSFRVLNDFTKQVYLYKNTKITLEGKKVSNLILLENNFAKSLLSTKHNEFVRLYKLMMYVTKDRQVGIWPCREVYGPRDTWAITGIGAAASAILQWIRVKSNFENSSWVILESNDYGKVVFPENEFDQIIFSAFENQKASSEDELVTLLK